MFFDHPPFKIIDQGHLVWQEEYIAEYFVAAGVRKGRLEKEGHADGKI